MQETSNYNLNKPEVTDPLRLEDFNENADKIDGAIKAVEQTVAGAYGPNNLPWVTGSIDLSSAEPGDTLITFDFEPSAILFSSYSSLAAFATNGKVALLSDAYEDGVMVLALRGQKVTLNGVEGVRQDSVVYMALK